MQQKRETEGEKDEEKKKPKVAKGKERKAEQRDAQGAPWVIGAEITRAEDLCHESAGNGVE